jgi:cytochrome c553
MFCCFKLYLFSNNNQIIKYFKSELMVFLNILSRLIRSACLILLAFFSVSSFAADAPIVGDPVAAQAKVAMCIGCHGIKGYRSSFPEVYSVPMIAGQSQEYLVVALQAYASGERTHPTMLAISKSLSPQDMADLAAYYANTK